MAVSPQPGPARGLPVRTHQSRESPSARSATRLGAWRSNRTFAEAHTDQREPVRCHKPERSFHDAPARRKTRASSGETSASGPAGPVRSLLPRAARSVCFPEETARMTFHRWSSYCGCPFLIGKEPFHGNAQDHQLCLGKKAAVVYHRHNIAIHDDQTAIPRALVAREAQRQFVEKRDFQNAVGRLRKKRYRPVAQYQHTLRLEWGQMKMFRGIDHEVRCLLALQSERNLGRAEGEWSAGLRLKPFESANFPDSIRGNRKPETAGREKDHGFMRALICRQPLCSHSTPALAAPKMYITRRSMALYMDSIGSVWSTAPVLMASCGMPKMTAVASSCTITWPPRVFTACTPLAPSLPIPVRITAVVIGPKYSAALSNVRSAQGRYPLMRGPSSSDMRPVGEMRRWCEPGQR